MYVYLSMYKHLYLASTFAGEDSVSRSMSVVGHVPWMAVTYWARRCSFESLTGARRRPVTSYDTYEWVMTQTWMSHVTKCCMTRRIESRDICAWVVRQIWMLNHKSYIWMRRVTHMDELGEIFFFCESWTGAMRRPVTLDDASKWVMSHIQTNFPGSTESKCTYFFSAHHKRKRKHIKNTQTTAYKHPQPHCWGHMRTHAPTQTQTDTYPRALSWGRAHTHTTTHLTHTRLQALSEGYIYTHTHARTHNSHKHTRTRQHIFKGLCSHGRGCL